MTSSTPEDEMEYFPVVFCIWAPFFNQTNLGLLLEVRQDISALSNALKMNPGLGVSCAVSAQRKPNRFVKNNPGVSYMALIRASVNCDFFAQIEW